MSSCLSSIFIVEQIPDGNTQKVKSLVSKISTLRIQRHHGTPRYTTESSGKVTHGPLMRFFSPHAVSKVTFVLSSMFKVFSGKLSLFIWLIFCTLYFLRNFIQIKSVFHFVTSRQQFNSSEASLEDEGKRLKFMKLRMLTCIILY